MSRTPLQLVDASSRNPCGGCTACCAVLRVSELCKDFHQPCRHVDDGGCRIYADRPKTCREWSCLWALGMLPGGQLHRPDRLGLILDMVVLPGIAFITAYEVWAGASQAPEARSLLDGLRARYKLCVISPERQITSSDAVLAAELRLPRSQQPIV